jgi:hypothetical protein
MNQHTTSHLARLLTFLALVGAVLLASTQQRAWATPAQDPFGQTIPTATPGRAVDRDISLFFTTNDGAFSVVLPANALRAPASLVLQPMAPEKLAPASPGFGLLGRAFEVLMFDAQGRQVLHPSFANPIQVCFAYTAADLATAGAHPADLVVQFFDTSTSAWVPLPTTPDPRTQGVCGSVTHLALFALTARSAGSGAEPQAGAFVALTQGGLSGASLAAPDRPTWLWVLIVLGILAGIAVALGIRRLKRTL